MRLGWLIALRGLIVKELRQVLSDPKMIPLLVVGPILQLIIFGYAATLDVATARVVVVDEDHSPESRALALQFAAAESFELVGEVATAGRAEGLIAVGAADVALVVGEGYGREKAGGQPTAVQLLVDGTDSTSATVAITGAAGLVQSLSTGLAQTGEDGPPPAPARVSARTRVLYNPELKSRVFMVPGVLAIVLLIVTMIATAMAVVREKETGTLEQLVVTPVSRATLLAGKLVPFALFGLVDTFFVLVLSRWLFQVPFEGSVWLLLANVPAFLACTLGLGLLVSTVSRTQQEAMMTAMFLVMLPMIYLSGFVFPIESMPRPVQPLTELVPVRHFLVILRGVMLKGAGAADLWPSIAKLAGLGAVTFGASVALFHKRID
ncbi:MAG: ABC transporter permease [Myxococcaceae bacterium]